MKKISKLLNVSNLCLRAVTIFFVCTIIMGILMASSAKATPLYSVTSWDNLLREINPMDAATISSISITLSGGTVYSANGLAVDPTTGRFWVNLRTNIGNELATLNPITGVATSIGDLGDNFSGLAFDSSGTLYGVTGDGASTPETLFTLDKTNATPTFFMSLGNGNDGEAIGFNPSDGYMYHASGLYSDPIFEYIDLNTKTITDIGSPLADEVGALTYWGEQNCFLWSEDYSDPELYRVTSTGTVKYVGALDHRSKGLAFAPNYLTTMIVGLGPVTGNPSIPGGWGEEIELLPPHNNVAWRLHWSAYNAANGETRPAKGDLNGDGLYETVVGLGQGGDGWLEVMDNAGNNLAWIRVDWPAYNSANGETHPACGDLDEDGRDEIVIGLGTGGDGWLEVLDDADAGFAHLAWIRVDWPAYNSANGETHPACGDLGGGGWDEIVIGLGTGGDGYLEVLDDAGAGFAHLAWIQVDWPAYNSSNGETHPACGDLDEDGRDETVIGLGTGGDGWLEVINDMGAGFAHLAWIQVDWPAYNSANGETHPTCGNLDIDSRDEIVIGLGQGGDGWLELKDDATSGYVHLSWPRVHWPAYNSANGETRPALAR